MSCSRRSARTADGLTLVLHVSKFTATPDVAAKRKALSRVRKASKAVRDHDEKADALRDQRNDAIVAAAEFAPATEIATAAGIKQSYISRVIRSGGKPGSGAAVDKAHDAERAHA